MRNEIIYTTSPKKPGTTLCRNHTIRTHSEQGIHLLINYTHKQKRNNREDLVDYVLGKDLDNISIFSSDWDESTKISDSNGTLIFAGDIVSLYLFDKYLVIGIVAYSENECQYGISAGETFVPAKFLKTGKVIGNVHELKGLNYTHFETNIFNELSFNPWDHTTGEKQEPEKNPGSITQLFKGKIAHIYTDGGCENNRTNNPDSIGAYAAILVDPDTKNVIHKITGSRRGVTNNLMEMQAVIEALRFADEHNISCLKIFSDSQYVVNGITKWIHSWLKNNWKGGSVANIDKWKEMLHLVNSNNKTVRFEWIKGHAKNTFNELCDELCTINIAKEKEKEI